MRNQLDDRGRERYSSKDSEILRALSVEHHAAAARIEFSYDTQFEESIVTRSEIFS